MPQIDVGREVLLDPMIAGESFQVIRRAETVSERGVSSVAEEVFDPVLGSVVPSGDNSLLREEAFQTQSQSIRVITLFRLRGASGENGESYQPDIVVWKGGSYLVRTVDDYSNYGAGMIVAECIATNYTAVPPQEAE